MSPQRLEVLLSASMVVWNVNALIETTDTSLAIRAGDRYLEITRAPYDLLFRWMLHDGTRNRVFASVPALLRGLRNILDPGHPITSVRIAPLSMTLP